MTEQGQAEHERPAGGLLTAILLTLLYGATALPMAVAFAPATLVAAGGLGALLVALSAVDLAQYRVPDVLTLSLALLGLAATWLLAWEEPWLRVAAGAAGWAAFRLVAALFWTVRGYDGLGLGDAKLLGAAGVWVGLEGLASVVLGASLLAIAAVAVAYTLGRPVARGARIPFAPFLGLATWLVWLYGPMTF